MSMRPCNRCDLERMKRFAAAKGCEVVVKPAPKGNPLKPEISFPNGVDVFLIDNERGEGEIWMAWYAELPENCRCQNWNQEID